MKLAIIVHADDETDLRAALGAVASAIPPGLFARPRPFRIDVRPEDDEDYLPPVSETSGFASEPATPLFEDDAQAEAEIEAEAVTPPAAASAAAPKKRSRAGPKAVPSPTTTAEDADPLGLNEPTEDPPLTAAQAKVEALVRLKRLFALPGGADITKRVLAQFGAVRFADVADDRGHELLEAAIAAEAEYDAR